MPKHLPLLDTVVSKRAGVFVFIFTRKHRQIEYFMEQNLDRFTPHYDKSAPAHRGFFYNGQRLCDTFLCFPSWDAPVL